MAGGKGVLAVIGAAIELVVCGAAEAGVAGVGGGGFLIEIGVAEVERQAAAEAAIQLGLESMGAAMSEVAETNQITAELWIGEPRQISVRIGAIAVIGATCGDAITGGRAERLIARRNQVTVDAADEAAHVRSEI